MHKLGRMLGNIRMTTMIAALVLSAGAFGLLVYLWQTHAATLAAAVT